ncbi:hypothetical protein BDV11DRAFT_190617 [Aspergillus similis]
MKKPKKYKKIRPSGPEATNEEPMPAESEAAPSELPEIEYNQPKSSPYEHPIATIVIGKKRYGIPVHHIQGIPQIRAQYGWGPEDAIILADVDEDVGHTVVHFLYTGQYETLDAQCDRVREYRRSVLAYQAATTYGIFGLEAVASKYIEHFGALMQLEDILGAAQEVFRKLPYDEVWFRNYLKEYFVQSFKENMHFFHREEFANSVGRCPRLDRTIMQLTVEILSARIAELENTVEQVNGPEPVSEQEPLPEPAPEHESDIAPEAAPESDSSTPSRANDFVAEFPANHEKPADLECSEEEAPIPEPEVRGSPEYAAESPPIEIGEPAPTFSYAEPPLERYSNIVILPRRLSPVEVGPVAEKVQEEYSLQEHPVPEPVHSDFNDNLYGSSLKKQKKKKKAMRNALRSPPDSTSWS